MRRPEFRGGGYLAGVLGVPAKESHGSKRANMRHDRKINTARSTCGAFSC